MAGTFELTDQICWMPPGWFYDPVLRRIAASLPNHMTKLRSTLLASLTDMNGGYCDLRGESLDNLLSLRVAARKTRAALEKEGPESLVIPDGFGGLQRSVTELIDMLDRAVVERLSESQGQERVNDSETPE